MVTDVENVAWMAIIDVLMDTEAIEAVTVVKDTAVVFIEAFFQWLKL